MAETKVRIMLLQSEESTRKNGRTAEHVLDEFECDVEDQPAGMELMDAVADYLEAEHGYDFAEGDDGGNEGDD